MRPIDEEHLMEKVSRMIDYCEKNKDKKFNALDILFQVGDAIMDCPTLDVVPREEVAKIFEEIERLMLDGAIGGKYPIKVINPDKYAELKKKYTEVESNG